jgi:hypothetical protein
MKSTVVLIFIFYLGWEAHSQGISRDSLSTKKWLTGYYFQIQSGTLIGGNASSDEISFSGATTHGVKVGRKLRVGAGVGLDSYYQWSTVPLFGSISWDLLGKKNALFVEFNYGGALASWRQINFEEYGYTHSQGGKVYSYGMGYRIKYEKLRISGGVGRKTQLMTTYYEYPTYYWDNNNYLLGEPTTRKVKNELNRLMVWIAVGLN